MCRYPNRSESHVLEAESERFFINSLPNNWTSEKPLNDYGIDQRVEIFNVDSAEGLELLIQLKASENENNDNEYEKIRLKVSTYNYLWDKLQVVMFVKYIRSINQAYWILMSDIPDPNQDQQTFTVRIPKQNTLTSMNWENIRDYVQDITYQKLSLRTKGGFQRYSS